MARLIIRFALVQMSSAKIKIIKRERRKALEEDGEKEQLCLKTENEIRREILNTITSWVEHQRQAKRTYGKALFKGLKHTQSEPGLL